MGRWVDQRASFADAIADPHPNGDHSADAIAYPNGDQHASFSHSPTDDPSVEVFIREATRRNAKDSESAYALSRIFAPLRGSTVLTGALAACRREHLAFVLLFRASRVSVEQDTKVNLI
jgi:hypothetical protein